RSGSSPTKASGRCAGRVGTSRTPRRWRGSRSPAPRRWPKKPDCRVRSRHGGTASRIHAEICERGYDAARNTFTQSYGSRALDASLLILPIIGFLPPHDPRMVGTVAAIERDLIRDGLLMRYSTEDPDSPDGLPPGEGAFLACSFWLVWVYGMMGRGAEARALFERLVALRNDVGLLSEEYDPRTKRLVGNFPQAFSHMALVNAAVQLAAVPATAGSLDQVAAA